ncbi:MAG: TetR/AcrR family transcriptional regulator [Streptosporangiaceae bacterium]
MAPRRPSPRERLLVTAGRLFYAEGIHTVPVDRLVSEAGVTRATFYRHFRAKEDLVVAYLKAADAELRAGLEAMAPRVPAAEGITVLLDHTAATIGAAGFRGCHFVNAAAEYPDPAGCGGWCTTRWPPRDGRPRCATTSCRTPASTTRPCPRPRG